MRRLAGWLTIGLVLWAAVMMVGLFTSEGEPVCSGVFITSIDDSDPPQCPPVWQGAFELGAPLLGLAVVASCLGFAIATGFARRQG